jgi:hypothetical protein
MPERDLPPHPLAEGRPAGVPDPSKAMVDASRAAVARKTNHLPPGEHSVELRAVALPGQMVLRIVAASLELGAGMRQDLDQIFGPAPDLRTKAHRSYAAQGNFWFSVLDVCGLDDADLQGITLDALAQMINGKRVIAVIGPTGFWNRVRPL